MYPPSESTQENKLKVEGGCSRHSDDASVRLQSSPELAAGHREYHVKAFATWLISDSRPFCTYVERMTPHQEIILEHLAKQHGISIPFLDPVSGRFNKCPSKSDAARLIAMLMNGKRPIQEDLDMMPEVPHEDFVSLQPTVHVF